MPLAMTSKFIIIEPISRIRLLFVMLLCMFPGRGGYLLRQLGSPRQLGNLGTFIWCKGSWALIVKELDL